ncbi:hypothetical protein EXIGLDRAFT_724213 [Exidia glandulosa HHB12029]|uniref:Uncharacterized protein n=1 Tax=Exidia glandulosa HHB12029 TaxID=1314781 RepID=A0A165EHA2_EXIGL|nr:hypothetical protein EXIGLDRAFT_724213 [Exidia glandulosa HHB12029]
MLLSKSSVMSISLDSAGLVALADLASISERTALTGTASFTDVLLLAPGIHTQQQASNVNGGEFPAVAAMTSGFVFRIENQAMVFYLQRVSSPGHLTSVAVERVRTPPRWMQCPSLASVLYSVGIGLTIISFVALGIIRDFWAIGVLMMLVLARALNFIVMRRRAAKGWKGKSEPGVPADLLVLLSQDRWVRIQGLVDDVKEVTSGQWLRDVQPLESFAVACATLIVYSAAALATNASTIGSLFIALHLLASVALLGLCNALTRDLHMFNCRVYTKGTPRRYERRLDMANEMIASHDGRRDWAVGMGLVLPEAGENFGQAIM